MNEPDKPPLGAPSIGAEQARRCVDAYRRIVRTSEVDAHNLAYRASFPGMTRTAAVP